MDNSGLGWAGRVETTDAGQLEKVVANTRGVDDVEGEERNPAEQKHTCHSTAHNGARMLTIHQTQQGTKVCGKL